MSNIAGDIESAPQTFSSWNQCMTKVYCKYPAIIGIVIASLIVLSIVWCFARCLCCGASCCCSCLRCCGCLESCTRPRGSNQPRHKDEYAPVQNQSMPYQGYQAPPMMYGAAAVQAPQFATFDASSRKVNEDSLPAMPSWDTAQTRRVEDDSQDMEMKHLEASSGQRLSRPNMYAPMASGAITPVHSPAHSPYVEQDAYMHGGAQAYGSDLGAQRMNQNPDPYGHEDTSYNRVPLSPAPTYNSGPAPTYHTTQPRPPVQTNQSFNYDRYNAPPQQQQWSPVESTRYEPTESQYQDSGRNYQNVPVSPVRPTQEPPSFQSFAPQGQGQRGSYQQPAGQARPPSFLQVGRKPVNGSVREL